MTTSAFPWLDSNPSDGQFDINQAWHLDYVPYKDFKVRIEYKSKYSQQAEEDMTKVDIYWLRIGDVCEQDTLTKDAEFPDWLYIIWSTQVNESRQPDFT